MLDPLNRTHTGLFLTCIQSSGHLQLLLQELGLARADFWPKGGVLPGGGTPEARHSKVTEAFSRTALLTGPGSMLGGTMGLKGETALGGCGLWAAPSPRHSFVFPPFS